MDSDSSHKGFSVTRALVFFIGCACLWCGAASPLLGQQGFGQPPAVTPAPAENPAPGVAPNNAPQPAAPAIVALSGGPQFPPVPRDYGGTFFRGSDPNRLDLAGFYFHILKLGYLLAIVMVWHATAAWVDQDARSFSGKSCNDPRASRK